ncbi:MAG: serine hydrolase [Marinibacterium sp.]|nr:serine hydrolase [Marinibacterium sp.]
MSSYRNTDPIPPIMAGSPPPPEWRVPRADWDRPPWNRWSFQNIRKILPTENIGCGCSPTQWIVEERDLTKVAFDAFDGTPSTVSDVLNEYTDGFLVAKGGVILHESYHNGMTRQTQHLSQSVAKSVVSTVAGVLIAKGRLDPTELITTYLPELERTAWRGATVQHVLDMTTGVRYVEEYTDPNSDMGRTDVACGWKQVPDGADPADWPTTLWDQIMGLTECETDHGARFKYRSIETDVLGFTISRLTGLSLAEAISVFLWAPMGAENPACITVDPAGTGLGDGGMCATLRDYARFGQTMLDNGLANGRQVIPADWVADVRSGDHGRFDDQSREFMPNGRYRNMFWIQDADRMTHMSLGVFGQFIYVSPERDMVVVQLSSWPEFLSSERHSNTMRAINAIAAEIC